MNIQLLKGDCLIESDKIESGSVDLILTDLPYGTVKDLYKNTGWDVVINTDKIMSIANRILRKNGKMVLFCQEPFTSELKNKAIPNIPFNQRLIWEKDSSGNMLFAKKACVNFYEDVLVFSKNHEFEALHPLRDYALSIKLFTNYSRSKFYKELKTGGAQHFLESNKESSQFSLCTKIIYNKLIEVYKINEMQGFKEFDYLQEIDNQFKQQFASTFNLWEGKKYKSNILKYKKDYTGHHPTQKPVLLLEDLIKTFSNEEDTVVDLTMGSGSTGVACVNTNRSFTGIEMDDKYFDIAQERINTTKA